ncbi:MAG: alpha/beta hydrolase [Candidatus Bathyarchaeota archaeon]|nr:alpha/beta hydrolase [Candidatus Bathyarchaeota archaeon]
MVEKGVFGNGVPYVKFGEGDKPLLVFSGGPGNYLPSDLMIRLFGQFKLLSKNYVVYVMSRKSGLPEGYTTRDMAKDYATVINTEFGGGPLDVMGMSYGGLIVQHLAADYPELIRRMVIAMSVYQFSDKGNKLDMRFAHLLSENKRRAALSSMGDSMDNGIKRGMLKLFLWLIAPIMYGKPEHPTDLVVEGKAELLHNTKSRLAEIKVPTLVIGGDNDFYCPVERLRETADGIAGSELVIYEGKGHMISGKQFDKDLLAFLNV